ncbi:MAG: hypothetical protein R3E01_25665 [Pirellulaceae bacterium]|nr:hypothetical protein [Planctomycetales bacterium]
MNELMNRAIMIGDRDSSANRWLREHPLVLGGFTGVIGLLLLFYGISGLKSGSPRGKFGVQLTGGAATVTSMIRLIMGIGLLIFAAYVAFFGAP